MLSVLLNYAGVLLLVFAVLVVIVLVVVPLLSGELGILGAIACPTLAVKPRKWGPPAHSKGIMAFTLSAERDCLCCGADFVTTAV